MRREPRELVLFNLSFVDVICCALGAIILLFIISSQNLTKNVSEAVRKYRKESIRANDAAQAAERMELKMREARATAESEETAAIEARNKATLHREEATIALIRAEKSERLARQESEQLKKTVEELRQSIETERRLIRDITTLKSSIEALQKKLGEESSQKGELEATLTKSTKQLKSILEKTGEEQTKLIQELRVLRESDGKKDAEIEELQREKQLLSDKVVQLEQDIKRETEKNQQSRSMETDREEQLELAQIKIENMEKQLNTLGTKSIFGIKPRYHRVVFLVDRSGSLRRSKGLKQLVVDTLSEILNHCTIDEFAVIAFSSTMKFYPPVRSTMVDGREEHKKKAANWYSSQSFRGQTYLRQAIEHAYEDYGELDAIFILTDGLPREGAPETTPYLIEEIKQYVRKQVKRQKSKEVKTRIVAIATGVPPDEHEKVYNFLHAIAELTQGQYLGR